MGTHASSHILVARTWSQGHTYSPRETDGKRSLAAERPGTPDAGEVLLLKARNGQRKPMSVPTTPGHQIGDSLSGLCLPCVKATA